MKIQVDCLRSRHGLEPRYFWLGARRLHVVEIVERTAGAAHQVYRVRIADRREFILDHDCPSREWRLVQVCAPDFRRRGSPDS